jgi:predicted esterase
MIFIESILENQLKISNKNKLFIGGFSQGAVLAQYIGLTSKFNFTKIVSLSGYCPEINYLKKNPISKFKQFMGLMTMLSTSI